MLYMNQLEIRGFDSIPDMCISNNINDGSILLTVSQYEKYQDSEAEVNECNH